MTAANRFTPPDPGPEGEVVEFLDPADADLVVYGHVSAEDAVKSLREWWLDMRDEEMPAPGPFRHLWAVWREPEEDDFFDYDDGAYLFEVTSCATQGAFRVTLAEQQYEIDRRAQLKAARDEARAACEKTLPYATIEHVHGYGDAVDVTFQGIRARWRVDDPGHVWVALRDREAWEAAVDAHHKERDQGA